MTKIVNTFVTPIYRNPSFQSEMVTEAFLWETVTVLENQNDWLKIKQWDGYVGWIHQFYLISAQIEDTDDYFFIRDRIVPLYSSQLTSAEILGYLSFGTKIPKSAILDRSKPFYQIQYPDGKTAWMAPKKKPVFINRKNLVKSTLELMGTPYRWGGKSGFGMDCSGFVQAVFLSFGIEFPRDAFQQYQEVVPVEKDSMRAGDLIFFSSENNITHVGISLYNGRFIHSSGSVRVSSIVSDDPLYEDWITEKFDSVRSIDRWIAK